MASWTCWIFGSERMWNQEFGILQFRLEKNHCRPPNRQLRQCLQGLGQPSQGHPGQATALVNVRPYQMLNNNIKETIAKLKHSAEGGLDTYKECILVETDRKEHTKWKSMPRSSRSSWPTPQRELSPLKPPHFESFFQISRSFFPRKLSTRRRKYGLREISAFVLFLLVARKSSVIGSNAEDLRKFPGSQAQKNYEKVPCPAFADIQKNEVVL